MAQLPNVYSLLGQATTSEYRRRRDEERKYRKDLERDRMRAMLLQPLIGAAATTGMRVFGDIAGDFLGNRLLPEGGRKFINTEAGRAYKQDITNLGQADSKLTTIASSIEMGPFSAVILKSA